jgi:hypothetical protein
MRVWTSEELDRVPPWFRARKHLPQEEVVAQFEQDFGHHRSFGAIQTASYRRSKTKGYGNPRKRRRTLPPDNSSPPTTATKATPVTEPSNITPQPLASKSVPRASISFLDALKSFPGSKKPRTAVKSAAELPQTAHAESQMPSNAADGTSWNESSNSSASASVIRSPGQAVTGVPCDVSCATVGKAVGGCVSPGNGGQLTLLGSTNDRDENGPCNTNTQICELRTPASFQPVNLRSRSGSGAVDVRAHASVTVAMIPAVNSDKDTRKTDSGPVEHAAIADSDGPISLVITRGSSVPGPQIVTGTQSDGGEAGSDVPNKAREGLPSSPYQYDHQFMSASVTEAEPRIVAGAFGPSRPKSSNTNRTQDLSQLSSHISAAQQLSSSSVQFTEAQQRESQSHEHHPYHTSSVTPSAPTQPKKPNVTIQSAPKTRITRSRSGCSACRKKRVECDENSPACMRPFLPPSGGRASSGLSSFSVQKKPC